MTALVTGGAGFIGSHVARELIAREHRVVIVDDLSGGSIRNLPRGSIFVRGDICDPELVDALFHQHKFEYVFHLAAYAAEALSSHIKRFNYINNLVGSVNLINASVNAGTVRCFVFTSSIAVYGHGRVPLREDMTPAPVDSYGIAKWAVEQELRASRDLFGLPYVIFRPHNVYGEGQNVADRYRNVIGIFMAKALRGEPFPVFGDGEQRRAFSHIAEVAPLIAESVDVPAALGGTFNVGGDTVYTVNEIAVATAQAMGVKLKVEHHLARHEVVDAYADHCRLVEVFKPGWPLDLVEGLARMAEWVKRQPVREASTFAGIEIVKNLPPSWTV